MVFPLWRQPSTVQIVFAQMRQLAVGRFDHRFHIGLVLVVVFLFYSVPIKPRFHIGLVLVVVFLFYSVPIKPLWLLSFFALICGRC